MNALERPRIGFIRHNFLPTSETFIFYSLQALAAHADVDVFAIERSSPEKFAYDRLTIPGVADATLYRTTGYSPAFFRFARSVDLLHAHMGYNAVNALYAARKLGKPLVTSFYGKDAVLYTSPDRFLPAYWHFAVLRKQLLAHADRICVLSNHMRDALVAQGARPDSLRVVPLGVDLSRFAGERPVRTGTATVLMVGREVEKKGFDDGLRACAEARANGADLRVVLLGTGNRLRGSLMRLAEELELPVEWPDPSTRVPVAMFDADILLVPSRTASDGDQEGTPTVICEGSAAGLPIVSTRHAGIPEQVVHETTGLLSAERDVADMARSLVRLAGDPALRTRMGEAGRAKMNAEYSVESHARALAAVYRELL